MAQKAWNPGKTYILKILTKKIMNFRGFEKTWNFEQK